MSDRSNRLTLMAAIAIASVLAWQTYWGAIAFYPFTILATWFHEMGHGLAAIATGESFELLEIYPDGSGVALSTRSGGIWGYLASPIISAFGLLGPAIAGSLLIIASRSTKATRRALMILGSALLLSVLIWVRSLTGLIVLPLLGLAILYIARRANVRFQHFAIQFLGVQACISTYRQTDYLFTDSVIIDGQRQLSDTGAIAQALFLPHWFWASAVTVVILAMLVASFRIAYR